MVSIACLLLRLLRLSRLALGRGLLGLLLVLATGASSACTDAAAAAGQRIGRLAERPALVQADDAPAPLRLAQGGVLPGRVASSTHPDGHPCDHENAGAGVAPGSDPCTSPDSHCAGLCAAVCLPAAGAGTALPFTPAGMAATGRAEACPQQSGWTRTGRSVSPESPPPIV